MCDSYKDAVNKQCDTLQVPNGDPDIKPTKRQSKRGFGINKYK